ncbi:Aminopeptidase Y [Verticillium dahliae VDG1]|nr:Aminopeptidase Y [Verticillium dahliae VDG1]
MSRFFPHTAFAEDQPLARTILWTHVLTRAATMGSILGLGTFALRSAAGSRVEWLDRSWRLRANPFQTEVDDWTYGASLAALGIAGVSFRKQMAHLGWRGLVGVAGLGSVVGTVGYMGWRHGIKGGTFAA